jgi:hypothetical protein
MAGAKDDMAALAKARDVAIREDHQGQFKRIIAGAREEADHPYKRLLKADPDAPPQYGGDERAGHGAWHLR